MRSDASREIQERDRFVGFVLADVEEWPADKRISWPGAEFIDEHTVQIDDHTQISAGRIVIPTGSRPVILPQWQGLGDKLIINDDVFSWNTLPKAVAVFGPGRDWLGNRPSLAPLGC